MSSCLKLDTTTGKQWWLAVKLTALVLPIRQNHRKAQWVTAAPPGVCTVSPHPSGLIPFLTTVLHLCQRYSDLCFSSHYFPSSSFHVTVCCHSCRFELLHDSVESDIFVTNVPARIGTLLDFSQGRLVFFNAQNGQCLGSFQKAFSQPCFPIFTLERPGNLELKMTMEVPEFAKHW